MAIIPWRNKGVSETRESNALPPAVQFRNEIDRLFERFLRNPWSALESEGLNWFSSNWMPSLDLNETGTEIRLNLEVPGVDPKNIEISISGNMLTIEGEKSEEVEDKGKGFYRSERRFGSFRRTVELPQPVEEDSISADYKNGVLTIKAKKAAGTEKKKIPISYSH
ncbi:MAG TPA: Hsp20/alpha crystallin family protein [Oligoflexia bacterium]|nr:Hsp20/alpha crystallin family protein [Oligoflexia bacterium]